MRAELPNAELRAHRAGDVATRQAERYGDRRPCSCATSDTWSYAQSRRTFGCAQRRPLRRGRHRKGDRRGDPVRQPAPNSSNCFLGCGWIGAVSVPINVAARGPAARAHVEDAGARLLVLERDLLPALEFVDFGASDGRGDLGDRSRHAARASAASACAAISGLARARRACPAPADLKPQDLLTILFTSGTTGPVERRVLPRTRNIFWWGFIVLRQLACAKAMCCTPHCRCFTSTRSATFFQALLNGSHAGGRKGGCRVSNFWPALVASGATVTYVLGAMVPMLLSRPPCRGERSHKVRGRARTRRTGASA